MNQGTGTQGDDGLAALAEAQTGEAFGAALEQVFERFQEHVDAHRYDAALPLAEAMVQESARRGAPYLRTRAWAALTLGLCCTRDGRHERADAVVTEHVELLRREVRRAHLEAVDAREAGDGERAAELAARKRGLRLSLRDLYDRRALGRIGAGRTDEALADLGAALAMGSRDAALVLGRLALLEGDPDRARGLLGPLLVDGDGEAWARRGWGLTMLP